MPRLTSSLLLVLATLHTGQAHAQSGSRLSDPNVQAAAPPRQAKPETWEVRDARLIVGAERLTNAGVRSYSGFRNGEKVGEVLTSEVALLQSGAELTRLSFDYARNWTMGGVIGYRGNSSKLESTEGEERQVLRAKNRNFLLGVRGGLLVPLGGRFATWLRLGYELQYDWIDPDNGLPVSELWTHSLVLDPRFVFSPASHVGMAIGPYLLLDHGREKADDRPWLDPLRVTGFRAGVSVDLYALVGG